MRVPTASVRRAARAFEATTSAFTLPPVIVAYDVDDAERALLAHGFVPNDPECAELALVGFDVVGDDHGGKGERTRRRSERARGATHGSGGNAHGRGDE